MVALLNIMNLMLLGTSKEAMALAMALLSMDHPLDLASRVSLVATGTA